MILKGLLYLAWFVFEQSKGMFLLNIDFRKFIQQTISQILTNIVIQSSYHWCLIKFDLLILTTNLHIRKASIYSLFSMHYIYYSKYDINTYQYFTKERHRYSGMKIHSSWKMKNRSSLIHYICWSFFNKMVGDTSILWRIYDHIKR